MPLLSILVLALLIFTLIDIITRDDSQVKHLPKMAWIIIVILLPMVGSIVWFAVGREYSEGGISFPRMPRRGARPNHEAPMQQRTPADPRTTEQQIADLDREIEEWRLREEIAKRKRDDAAGSGGGQ